MVFYHMNEGRTVFAHLLDCPPRHEFDKSLARYCNFRVWLAAYLRTVPHAGFRPTYMAIEFAGHRNLSDILRPETPSCWHPPTHRPQHVGGGQGKAGRRIFADFARRVTKTIGRRFDPAVVLTGRAAQHSG